MHKIGTDLNPFSRKKEPLPPCHYEAGKEGGGVISMLRFGYIARYWGLDLLSTAMHSISMSHAGRHTGARVRT